MPDHIDAAACRRLWADVFLASVTDAWNDPADRWLGTRDYFTVAALAGIDHDAARDLVTALRARHARMPPADAAAGRTRGSDLPAGILRGAG